MIKKEIGMAKLSKDNIVAIVTVILVILNVWVVKLYGDLENEINKNEKEIVQLKTDICTKEEMKVLVKDVVDSRFDKFELFLQEKYKITPKK